MPKQAEKVDILLFMLLRAAKSPESQASRNFIRDWEIAFSDNRARYRDIDLFGEASPSDIAKLIYKKVFCEPASNKSQITEGVYRGDLLRNAQLAAQVIQTLQAYQPDCPNNHEDGVLPLDLSMIERHAYIKSGNKYFILPDDLPFWPNFPYSNIFPEIRQLIRRNQKSFELSTLVSGLEVLFGISLYDVVFLRHQYAPQFTAAKRTLFDALYTLYVARRLVKANLEHVIEGLQILHLLEGLAIDRFVEHLRKAGKVTQKDAPLWELIQLLHPSLKSWNFSAKVEGFPLVDTQDDFDAYCNALPIVHPLFARLYGYPKPFNNIMPIGVGDLKVVKKWLLAYEAGDIASIENVLMGEGKTRTHVRDEKTENTFSFTSSRQQESSKDTQATDRFELKREIDSLVSTNSSTNANASMTYTSPHTAFGQIVSTVAGGVTYGRNTNDQMKAADNYSREVISKALDRVQTQISQSRSSSQTLQTTETNVHSLSNTQGTKHVSGIYRWVDKKYRAQVFNYGKRMMFEFVIPEPAAFWVDSRLKDYAANMTLPVLPTRKVEQFNMPADVRLPAPGADAAVLANAFTEASFNNLRARYELSDSTYPDLKKSVVFLNQATGQAYFHEDKLKKGDYSAFSYACRIDSAGYELSALSIEGVMNYADSSSGFAKGPDGKDVPHGSGNENKVDRSNSNRFIMYLDGTVVAQHEDNTKMYWCFEPPQMFQMATPRLKIIRPDVMLTIGLWDGEYYDLTVTGDFILSGSAFADFQTRVYKRIYDIEHKAWSERDQANQQDFDQAMAVYQNRMDQIKTMAVRNLVQGQSDAFNQQVVQTELKKHCLSMITKEFDADASDDIFNWDALQDRPVNFGVTRPNIDQTVAPPSFEFRRDYVAGSYPAISLTAAAFKGRYVQFLEQAFDWQQISYMFYPYFWSAMPNWIRLLNLSDDTDPTLSAFLQAGSCRVLVAVTPAYEQAVLHYIATREPWDGGPSPAIGDPLFISLYEELRNQQDDRRNAIPEGDSWTFTMPTSLVYVEDSTSQLPTFDDPV